MKYLKKLVAQAACATLLTSACVVAIASDTVKNASVKKTTATASSANLTTTVAPNVGGCVAGSCGGSIPKPPIPPREPLISPVTTQIKPGNPVAPANPGQIAGPK
jgi:hypothetical protein